MEHRINLNKYSLCCINFKDLERKKILLRTTRLESFQKCSKYFSKDRTDLEIRLPSNQTG